MVSGWQQDECYDPIHREAYVKVAGEIWHLHRTGHGTGMVARPEPYNLVNARRIRMIDRVEDLA